MANNIKYAQNLIGDWSKDIYEPKKQVLQDIYQTNWNKLSSDYNTLKDTLARNYNLARQSYTKALDDVQNESFNRMNAATVDLANRGLSSSGVGNLVQNYDTQVKGEEVNKALSSLLDTGLEGSNKLLEGVNTLGAKQTDLSSDLGGDLAGLTDADAANMQQYAGLVSNISESAASRAASRVGSSKKDTSAADELDRRLAIAQTLSDENLTDDEKISNMAIYLNVPVEQARSAVSAYNYDVQKEVLDKRLQSYGEASQKVSDNRNKALQTKGFVLDDLITSPYNIFSLAQRNKNTRSNAVREAAQDLSKYTYGDIYDILYGNK